MRDSSVSAPWIFAISAPESAATGIVRAKLASMRTCAFTRPGHRMRPRASTISASRGGWSRQPLRAMRPSATRMSAASTEGGSSSTSIGPRKNVFCWIPVPGMGLW